MYALNKQVHIMLQGKGGCGKSTISSLLMQVFESLGLNVLGMDTDPANHTLKSFKSLNVEVVEILNSDVKIDTRQFDSMVDKIINHDGPVVIDNGATSFFPVGNYIVENGLVDMLNSMGREVVFHSILQGGQAYSVTKEMLGQLLARMDAPVIVWENPFSGDVTEEVDGELQTFSDSQLYADNKHRIRGIVHLHRRTAETFGKDFEEMVTAGLTFAEAISSFKAMPSHRLGLVWNEMANGASSVLLKDSAPY